MSVLNSGKSKSRLGMNIRSLTLANKPSASLYNGNVIYISDVGNAGSYWISNGSTWSPVGGEVTLAQSGSAINLTGSTSIVDMYSYTLPGGLMSSSGQVEINCLWSMTNSANNKQFRVYLSNVGSPTGGTAYMYQAMTSTSAYQTYLMIKSNNSTSSQKGNGLNANTGFSSNTSAAVTSSRDLTSDKLITFAGQLSLSSETITLLGYSIVYRG